LNIIKIQFIEFDNLEIIKLENLATYKQ